MQPGGSAARRPVWRRWWPWVVLGVCAVSALFVVLSDMRPSYDGFGFLVWMATHIVLGLYVAV